MQITPDQVATIARAIAEQDVDHVRVKDSSSNWESGGRIDYQVHYVDGTFGSHVTIRRDGTVV